MVESSPWYKNLPLDRGELPESYGSVGVKKDGGGSMAGRGRVGPMRLHRACNLRDMAALQAALDAGDDVNEVEAVRGAGGLRERRGKRALNRPPPPGGQHAAPQRLLRGLAGGHHLPAGPGRQGERHQHRACPGRRGVTPRGTASRLALPQAGDSPWHWADAMGQTDALKLLERAGAAAETGDVIVPEHVDKIKEFYASDGGLTHPLPSKEFMNWRAEADAHYAHEQTSLIPGL